MCSTQHASVISMGLSVHKEWNTISANISRRVCHADHIESNEGMGVGGGGGS